MLSVNNIKISSNVLINWYYLLGATKCDMWLNYGDNNFIWDKSRCHQMKLLLQQASALCVCVSSQPGPRSGRGETDLISDVVFIHWKHSWSSSIESHDRISHKLEISPSWSSNITIKMSLTKSDNLILFTDVHRYRSTSLPPSPQSRS